MEGRKETTEGEKENESIDGWMDGIKRRKKKEEMMETNPWMEENEDGWMGKEE